MADPITMTEREKLTAIVFGDTFALYDERSFDEFIEPLRVRLKANGIPPDVFKDKRCLDAGCGGGRGSILMAQYGAREVIGVDLSATNVETCRKRAAQKGFNNLRFVQHSLMELPFEDESFDVVWCNGVLHHTADPDGGLREITRVLKTGGHLWLYLYGSGGIYWYMVDAVREILHGVDVRDCICQLRLMDVPVRRIAEWIDDWFVPYLRRYTIADATKRLEELGYDNTAVLQRGTSYDTSQRRVDASALESGMMGEGDLRFFCCKTRPARGDGLRLPDPPNGKGSPYQDAPALRQVETELAVLRHELHALESARPGSIHAYKILASRAIHQDVRAQLESPPPFDVARLRRHLVGLQMLLNQFD